MSPEQEAGLSLEKLMNEMFGVPLKKVPEETQESFIPEQREFWNGKEFNDVEAPSHYYLFDGQLQVIDLIKERLTTEEYAGYLKGNMIKYLMRADKKNGRQDYEKLSQYIGIYLEEDDFNG